MTDGNGNDQSATYNSHNDPTTLTDAESDATTIAYATGTNNLTSITAPNPTPGGTMPGNSTSLQYSTPAGAGYATSDFRPTSETDAQTNVTTLSYNNFGETIASHTATGADSGTTPYSYQGR